jgi:sialidase-1
MRDPLPSAMIVTVLAAACGGSARHERSEQPSLASIEGPARPVLDTRTILPVAPLRPFFEEQVLFTSNTGGFGTIRAPALAMTPSGVLIAVAQAQQSLADISADKLIMRRSIDLGKSWEPASVIVDFGADTALGATMVVDRARGRVVLAFVRYPAGSTELTVLPGLFGPHVLTNWVTTSDDDGKSWSEPRDITASTKIAEWKTVAFGPCRGIQMLNGRLYLPAYHGPYGSWHGFVAWSDDGGESWTMGHDTELGANETAVVAISETELMLNARGFMGSSVRKIATSTDAGMTWSPLHDDPTLIEPQGCEASILRYSGLDDGYASIILFSNPATTLNRFRMTVRMSLDDAKTWKYKHLVYEPSSAYSCLEKLSDGSVALAYEKNSYAFIMLSRFSLAWITQ